MQVSRSQPAELLSSRRWWLLLCLIQLSTLGGLLAWAYRDPAFSTLAEYQSKQWGLIGEIWTPFQTVAPEQLGLRKVALACLLLLPALAWLAMAWLVVCGAPRRRSIAHWLLMLTFAAAWMATASGWAKLSRLGKRHRVLASIHEFDRLAKELRVDWPKHDGETKSLGQFMAYPISNPSMLILLTLPELKTMDATISVVERGSDGQLRFQLAGVEQGDWIEWHPAGSKPASFVGGICDVFELSRSDELGHGWYMVKYRSLNTRLHES